MGHGYYHTVGWTLLRAACWDTNRTNCRDISLPRPNDSTTRAAVGLSHPNRCPSHVPTTKTSSLDSCWRQSPLSPQPLSLPLSLDCCRPWSPLCHPPPHHHHHIKISGSGSRGQRCLPCGVSHPCHPNRCPSYVPPTQPGLLPALVTPVPPPPPPPSPPPPSPPRPFAALAPPPPPPPTTSESLEARAGDGGVCLVAQAAVPEEEGQGQ